MSPVISHHPDDATLVSYAAGTLAEPLAAVVAAHVCMCPTCQGEVADLELLGGTLMLAAAPEPTRRPIRLPKRPLDDAFALPKASSAIQGGLPAPIAEAFDLVSLENVPWRRLGPGVWHHRLALSPEEQGDLRLLRIGPRRTMPDHGHGGAELTLVLEGSYSDVTGEYRRGDIQDVDEGIEHQPIVGPDADCICLIASEHPARFKSLIGRISQRWTGL